MSDLISRRVQQFDEVTIRDLLGSFDAEQENIEKFKEYFVVNDFYKSFTADFPLRIAVGNKGTGKSAILRAALDEDLGKSEVISVPLTASDLVEKGGNLPAPPLEAINYWKKVFFREEAAKIVASTVAENVQSDVFAGKVLGTVSDLISWVGNLVSKKTNGASDYVVRGGLSLSRIRKVVFYLDDLDRGWDGRPVGLHFVNSIIEAAYDISKKESNIQFRIALRWDLWDAISRKNQDIDKIRQNAVTLKWTNHEIYVVVARRISKYFGLEFPYEMYLDEKRPQEEISRYYDPIIDPVFHGLGKWDGTRTRRVLLSMTRNRPRDLLALLTHAARRAHSGKRNWINSNDLSSIFPEYSQERLSDLSLEYGTRLEGLQGLLYSFKPPKLQRRAAQSYKYTEDSLIKHVKTYISSAKEKIRFRDEPGSPDFRRVIDFLYRIDFLQAWYLNESKEIERVNFQNRQIVISEDINFGYSWEVLPAYRWAIQPTSLKDVIDSLD